jgi:hypothetical protein
MATGKLISGNAIKNDGGSNINAGTVSNNRSVSLTFSTLNNYAKKDDVRAALSGTRNTGTAKPISGGVFNSQEKGYYIGMNNSTYHIAGVTNNALRSPGVDNKRSKYERTSTGYTRNDFRSWDYQGVLTSGGFAGAQVDPSGFSGLTGRRTDDSSVGKGELQFQIGAATPKQADYGN